MGKNIARYDGSAAVIAPANMWARLWLRDKEWWLFLSSKCNKALVLAMQTNAAGINGHDTS